MFKYIRYAHEISRLHIHSLAPNLLKDSICVYHLGYIEFESFVQRILIMNFTTNMNDHGSTYDTQALKTRRNFQNTSTVESVSHRLKTIYFAIMEAFSLEMVSLGVE